MKKKFFWLSASFALALAGCGGNGPAPGPSIKINDTKDGIVWDEVAGAVAYRVTLDEVASETLFPEFLFPSTAGEHVITVESVLSGGAFGTPSTFTYSGVESALGDLSYQDGKITWNNKVSIGLMYKIDDGELQPVVGEFISVEEQGLYTVVAPKGINEEKVFYCTEVSKSIVITFDGEEPYLIEDASASDDASLSDTYRKYRSKNGGAWEASGSDVYLDKSSGQYIDGNAAGFKFWYHGDYYMFEKDIAIPGAFNELSFDAVAGEKIDFYMSFQIKHNLVVGGVNLNGVYILYHITETPTKWTHYRISLDDAAWQVDYGGNKYSFATIAAIVSNFGFKVQKLSDFLPFFDVFQLRIKGAYLDGGPVARASFDNIEFINSDITSSSSEVIIPRLSLQENYAFKSGDLSGKIVLKDGTGSFETSFISIPVTYTVENEEVTIVSTKQLFDFVATFTSLDGGATLNLKEISGSLEPSLNQIQVEAFSKMDDFEQYIDTGIGYDKNHPESEKSSEDYLRGAYYSDWYSQNGPQSDIADSNWSLMGSTDYLYLAKENYHSGAKAMNMKAGSNSCRYMTYALKDGATKGYQGKYFSFWAKTDASVDRKIRVGTYFVNKVDASNHTSPAARDSIDITVTANGAWSEIRIPLDAGKTYYGFSFITGIDGVSSTNRIFVDDIYVLGDISPWGN